MVRCFKSIIIILLVVPLLCRPATAEADNEALLEQMLNAAPSEISSELNKAEIDVTSPETLNEKIGFISVLSMIWRAVTEAFYDERNTFAVLLTLIIFSALLKTFENKFSSGAISELLSVITAVTVILTTLGALHGSMNAIKSSLESMNVFTSACVPIIATVQISAGQAFSATLFSTVAALTASLSTSVSTYILVPLVNIFTSLGICSAVSEDFSFDEVTAFIKKTIRWFIIIFISIFTLSISLQSFLANSADSIAKRSIKIAVGGLIPVAGSTLAESIDGVFTMAQGVKGSFVIIGIFVILAIFLPILASAGVSAGILSICKCFSGFMNEKRLSKVMAVIADAFYMLMSVVGAAVIMTIISYLVICLGIGG